MRPVDKNDPTFEVPETARDIARFVRLCAGQIRAAADEAFREIDALSFAVLDTARHANALLSAADAGLGHAAEQSEDSTVSRSAALRQAVQNSSMRLQFADRLGQRLANVSTNLAGLADLMQSPDLPIMDTQWAELLEEARATFTMEQERQMFDAIFGQLETLVDSKPSRDASSETVLFEGKITNGH